MFGSLDYLLGVIIQQYFGLTKCLIMVSDTETGFSLNLPLGVLVVNVDVTKNVSSLADIVFHKFGCENFILNVEDPSRVFVFIENELPRYTETFNQRKYVVFGIKSTFEIFETKAINFVSNILLIYLDKMHLSNKSLLLNKYDMEVSFWTHKYTGYLENNKPVMLDRWFSANKSFAFGKNLFYEKVRNQHGRQIRVGVFDYRPYVFVEEESSKVKQISGAEIKLIRSIANYINATLKIVIQKDLWGYVYPNGSSYGLRGNVYNDTLDIGAAGLFLTQIAVEQFDTTVAYLKAELTCLVPAPRLAALWLSPYYSFSVHTWIGLILTYILLGIAIYLINYFQLYINGNTFNQNISKIRLVQKTIAAVGKPIILQPVAKNEYYFKPMLALVMLVTMTIGIAFNAGFASVMTKPIYENSINTIEDFLNSDIHWGGIQVADWIYSWKNGEEILYKKAAQRYIATSAENLRAFSKEGHFAFKIERVSDQHHIPPYIKEDIIENYHVMKDFMHEQYVILILRKNSILLPIMNKVIGRLIQSGIIRFWTQESGGHREYIIQRKLQYLKSDATQEPVILKLLHLVGAFSLLLLGNLMALVVFFIEILFSDFKKYHITNEIGTFF